MTSKYGFFGATVIALLGMVFASSASAQTMGSTNLMVVIPARAMLTVNTPTPAFASASTNDTNTGTTSFSYFIRASQTSGTGSIALKIDSNSALTYTCATKVGAACSIAQKANTSTATPIVSFGANTTMGLAGASGAINWSLPQGSKETAATHTSTATLVISTI